MHYREMVARLAKSGVEINSSLTDENCEMLHMALGIAGEAGELVDAIKKHVFYNKTLDMDNVVEELGDLEFYLEGMRQCIGVHRDRIIYENETKLGKRYSGFLYSDEKAQERADKKEDTTNVSI